MASSILGSPSMVSNIFLGTAYLLLHLGWCAPCHQLCGGRGPLLTWIDLPSTHGLSHSVMLYPSIVAQLSLCQSGVCCHSGGGSDMSLCPIG